MGLLNKIGAIFWRKKNTKENVRVLPFTTTLNETRQSEARRQSAVNAYDYSPPVASYDFGSSFSSSYDSCSSYSDSSSCSSSCDGGGGCD